MASAIIVAAGRGERLGASGPKAFVALAGVSLLDRCLATVAAVPAIGGVIVARPRGSPPLPRVDSVEGGDTRSASVRNALAARPGGGDAAIVVHDAARPRATPALFERVLAALGEADAAIAATPVTDTIKQAGPSGAVERTLERGRLWAVQTPQAFRRPVL